jgi:cellulose synthase/poly-beta-1,6-N-acetylglucosamine synthase-like glycosyltransferase
LHLLLIVLCITIGIQSIYFIVFSIAFSKKQNKREPQALPVSVIVCAHDEEENLKELIPALLSQNYPAFEIIIVDDRSNDSTFDLLLAEAAKSHRVRMVHVNRTPPHANSKKYALTLGIKAARYEWLLLTDADCRPSSVEWIRTMSSYFHEHTNFVLGYSPYSKRPGLLNAFIRFETLLTGLQYISYALLGNPYMGVGRNMAYRRSMFLAAKGFNNILGVTGGDDDLFVNKHAAGGNTSVCLEPQAQTLSMPEATWRAFLNQKVRHLSVGRRYRFGHRFLLGLFVLTWIISWVVTVLLAIFTENYFIIAGLMGFRLLLVTFTFQQASKTLGEKFELWIVPLLDFIYVFYYLVTGLLALVTKKVRWKN